MLFKSDGYSGWSIDLGEGHSLEKDVEDQLKLTSNELAAAIKADAVGDRLFRLILTNRGLAHKRLSQTIGSE